MVFRKTFVSFINMVLGAAFLITAIVYVINTSNDNVIEHSKIKVIKFQMTIIKIFLSEKKAVLE